ncbi:MAG: hypothetical protein LH481_00460 [Burkholderiales bacterium]|nr:hypothetical protein [Burkholderiales bacterium]
MSPAIKCLIGGVALVIVGCQSSQPVPKDRFFRLEAVTGAVAALPVLNEGLYVAPLRAEGPYAERAMLYASANRPRELQQYHYQHWSEPPAALLQEHMRVSLQAMAFAPRVTDVSTGSGIGFVLNAKVLRLEKLTDSDGGVEGGKVRAVVALHFALQRKQPFALLLERSYMVEEVVSENTQHGYVIASEVALKKVYIRLADDIKSLPK